MIHTHTHAHTHTRTHTHTHTLGENPLDEVSSLPEIMQHSQEIVVQAPGGIETRNSSKRVSAGLHLTQPTPHLT